MAVRALPSGEVTFLFTDIVGSTEMMHRHGERFASMLERHRAVLRASFEAEGGIEVSTVGDGFFFAFSDPDAAIQAAVQGQRELARQDWNADDALQVRMGIHAGRAEPIDGDYVSLAVNQAARVCAAANGGQILLTRSTAGRLSGDHRIHELGSFRLKGFTQPAALCDVRYDGAPAPASPSAPRAMRTNIKRPRTSFVGRRGDLGLLLDAAVPGAIVTVVGPGGVGKTRLASEVAARLAETSSDDVCFVDLTLIGPGSNIPAHIGKTVDGTDATETLDLGRSLSGVRMLVLDNCEHVAEGLPAVIDEIIEAAPHLTLLLTSQVPVGVEGERVHRLRPLDADNHGDDAVQLFIDRARAARLDFAPDDEIVSQIAAVVRSLDYLPLAIELAASRTGELSVTAIRSQLSARFDLLRTSRPASDRHRTLRAALSWSVDLLSPTERELLVALSIFCGWFDETGVTMVAVMADGDPFEHLGVLVERSLVVADPDGPMMRYRLLTSMRSFAREQLERDESFYDIVADRHLDWVRSCARDTSKGWLDIQSDLEAAVGWATGRHDRGEDAVRLAAMIQGLAEQGRFVGNRSRLFARALEAAPWIEERVRGHALKSLGTQFYIAGEYEAARRASQEAMAIARRLGDGELEARTENNLGAVEREEGALDRAEVHFLRALMLARANDVQDVEAFALFHLGKTARIAGDVPAAERHLRDGLALQKRQPSRGPLGPALLTSLGDCALERGHLDEARQLILEALSITEELGLKPMVGHCILMLGFVESKGGDLERADSYLALAGQIASELRLLYTRIQCWALEVDLALKRGRLDHAREALRLALARVKGVPDRELVSEVLKRARELARSEGHPDAERLSEGSIEDRLALAEQAFGGDR